MLLVLKKIKSYPLLGILMKEKSNQNKLEALLNGDEVYIRLLYNTLYPKVKSFVLKNRGTFLDAEELFHDALYQLIIRARVKDIQIKSSLDAYIFTICKNLWYKELNKRKMEVRNEGVFELKEKENNAIESILQQDRWDLFEEMFLKLSNNCRELLKDYFNKVTYDVIIDKFSYASKNVAFQRIFKCKKRLADLIKADMRYNNL